MKAAPWGCWLFTKIVLADICQRPWVEDGV